MPVRKIPKNYRSVTGKFSSIKNGRSISFESTLERDLFLTLEFDPSVTSYEEQPLVIAGEVDGLNIKYTPDCLATCEDGSQIIYEVKFQCDLDSDDGEIARRFRLAEAYAVQHGAEFKVVTEKEIRDARLDNLKFIYRFTSPPRDLGQMSKVIKSALKQPMPINQLLAALATDRFQQAAFIPVVWHLVFIRELRMDMDVPLAADTILEVSRHGATIA